MTKVSNTIILTLFCPISQHAEWQNTMRLADKTRTWENELPAFFGVPDPQHCTHEVSGSAVTTYAPKNPRTVHVTVSRSTPMSP